MRNRRGINAGIAACALIFGAAIVHKAMSPPTTSLSQPGAKRLTQDAARAVPGRTQRRDAAAKRMAPRRPAGLQVYTQAKPTIRLLRQRFDDRPAFRRKTPGWKEQTPAWRQQMQQYGARMRAEKVALVMLVHGTFTGKDPFGVVHLLGRIVPFWKPDYSAQLAGWIKRSNNALFEDKGNWLPAHVKLLQAALGKDVAVQTLPWSSRNDHLARVMGALHLLQRLAHEIQQRRLQGKRILLIGHSHAGQIFALLTHLLRRSPIAMPLLQIAAPAKSAQIQQALDALRRCDLDVVTMGTPPRYTWALTDPKKPTSKPRIRLLHLVNHRKKGHLAGAGLGVLVTRAGDYVQQWGIAGSDLLSAVPTIFSKNKQLETYLGPGADPIHWFKVAKLHMRLHHRGDTILVDYRDQSTNPLIPNFTSTMMGHAIYTELRALLFNTKLITEHWYRRR